MFERAGHHAEYIDNQSAPDNYVYDAIGNLIADKKDSISLIKWNVYGKIAEIQRMASTARPVSNIKYYYDAGGNRIGKRVERMAGTVEAHPVEYTWYVRDASGNTMAVYTGQGTGTVNGGHGLQLAEQHLYGSSRLGLQNRGVDMKPLHVSPAIVTFTRGNKFFELSNHLGNVLATVSDRKLQAGGGTVGQWQGYYEAEVVSAQEYYPFGSIMPGRKYSAGIKYRYGFNGKEKDDESNGEGNSYDYGFRIYNPRIARFLSVDPLTKSYPWYTPYQFAGNTPIQAIDLDGLEEYIVTTKYSKNGDKTITIEVVTKRGTNEVVNLQYRIVLTRDKDGNITKTGDPLTGKKIVRIVERPDKKPEVSFANKLTQEEKEVLKDLEMEVHGPSSDQIWTINIEGKQYDAIVERDLTKYDEKVAEKTFPNNHKRIVKSTPYEPGQVLRDFDGDLNFIAASSVASGVSSPQGELGPVMLSSLEKIAKDLKKNNSIKSITINLRIGSSEGEGTSSYDNVKYAATAAIWNISNFLESKLKGIKIIQGKPVVVPNKTNKQLVKEGSDTGVSIKIN